MLKSLLAAALALGLVGTAAGRGASAPRAAQPEADAEIERLVQRLDGANPFLYGDARVRLVRLGAPAVGALERGVLAASEDPTDDCLHSRSMVHVLGRIAEQHPGAAPKVKAALVRIAMETPDFVALYAMRELGQFDRDEVLLEFIRLASGPDEAARRRARVILFSMDKKAAADLMLDLLDGERTVPWYRNPRQPVRERLGGRLRRRMSWMPYVQAPPPFVPQPEPRERHLVAALERWTFHDLNYDAEAGEAERMEAIARWREWWTANRETFDKVFKLEDYVPLVLELEARRGEGRQAEE